MLLMCYSRFLMIDKLRKKIPSREYPGSQKRIASDPRAPVALPQQGHLHHRLFFHLTDWTVHRWLQNIHLQIVNWWLVSLHVWSPPLFCQLHLIYHQKYHKLVFPLNIFTNACGCRLTPTSWHQTGGWVVSKSRVSIPTSECRCSAHSVLTILTIVYWISVKTDLSIWGTSSILAGNYKHLTCVTINSLRYFWHLVHLVETTGHWLIMESHYLYIFLLDSYFLMTLQKYIKFPFNSALKTHLFMQHLILL